MVMLNENNIENFIRENKNQFEVYFPPVSHLEKFLFKLNYRIKHIVNIVPYLIRVAVVTVTIFISSIIVWNNYIRKDREEISLRDKITGINDKVRAYSNSHR